MPCYSPLKGYRSAERGESGRRSIVFSKEFGLVDRPVTVPCGQCIGCRLERSRQWAMRCLHEASLHGDNAFVTLTYDDEHLPTDRSLNLRHFQLFMKKLRFHFGEGIRFFHCGEYGDLYQRPHYHALLFNIDFPDKEIFKVDRGNRLYISETLSNIWSNGYAVIGDVSFQSAAYVSRYIMKKITGDKAEEHYSYVDPETGEVFDRKPEYTTMSRRPGIGAEWFRQFKTDVYPSDFVVINGVKMKPPKFYDKLYEAEFPSDLEKIKNKRVHKAAKHKDNNRSERLAVRETVQRRKLDLLKRSLEQ